jgi:hypothetical protein
LNTPNLAGDSDRVGFRWSSYPACIGQPSVISKLEVWAWACVCATLMAVRLYPGFVPNLSDDAFQYLSVAQNALAGHFGYTSLIHFDAERSFGVMPAPMVHFPLGYPFAIALVSLAGVPLQSAALLVSALSTVACVPLLAWTATQLGLSPLLRSVVLAGFVFNAVIIYSGASALSEALFTFLVLLGMALLVAARLDVGSRRWRWAAAGLALGAAYWVRYAGLFFVLGLAVLVIRHLVASNRSPAKGYALAVAVAGAAVLVGMARNILLVGHWQGTLDKTVSNPVLPLLVETVRAGKVLLLGPSFDMPGWTSILRTLFIAFFLSGMAWLTWWHLRHGAAQSHPRPALKGIGVDLLILTLTYCGCMFYAGLTSAISYRARMFVPLTPLVILLLGLALRTLLATPAQRSISGGLALLVLGASFCCYLVVNAVLVVRPPSDYVPSSVSKLMDSTSIDGRTAHAAVLELVGPAGVVVANNGQAIGHVLERPTVSLVEPLYSAAEWNEMAIYDVVHQYNAAAIIIYVNNGFMPSPFVRQLAQGEAPSWMKLVYRSSEFLVYEPLSRRASGGSRGRGPAG